MGDVSPRNTSSRVASRRLTSATSMPASSRARTTSTRRKSFGTGAVTVRCSPSIDGSPVAYWTITPAAATTSLPSVTLTSMRSPPMRDLSSLGEPSATVVPWSSNTMRSARRSASSRYCVVRISVVPVATRSRSICHRSSRLRGSRPVVGSSRNSTVGDATRHAARSSRRRMPPEYDLTSLVPRRAGRDGRGVRRLGPARRAWGCGSGGRSARGSAGRSATGRRSPAARRHRSACGLRRPG